MKTQTLAQAISEGFAKPEEVEVKEGALVAEALLSEARYDGEDFNEIKDELPKKAVQAVIGALGKKSIIALSDEDDDFDAVEKVFKTTKKLAYSDDEVPVAEFDAKNKMVRLTFFDGAINYFVTEALISESYLEEMGDMDDEAKEKLEGEMKDMTDEEKMAHVKKVKEGALEDEKSMKA